MTAGLWEAEGSGYRKKTGGGLAACFQSRSFFHLEEALQMPDSRRMAQFSQSFGFDLANTFASYLVLFANFFEGAFVAVNESEA